VPPERRNGRPEVLLPNGGGRGGTALLVQKVERVRVVGWLGHKPLEMGSEVVAGLHHARQKGREGRAKKWR
jgi:hypothetical protein